MRSPRTPGTWDTGYDGDIGGEPIDAEPIDAEPIDAEPIDAEPIDDDSLEVRGGR